MVAVNQDTGKIEWDDKLPSTPYGAAAVTSNVVFTTTYNGDLYAFNAATGAILLKTPLSAGTNAPVAIDGDYVIAAAGVPLSKGQPLIIAYKLGANGKLPDTVGWGWWGVSLGGLGGFGVWKRFEGWVEPCDNSFDAEVAQLAELGQCPGAARQSLRAPRPGRQRVLLVTADNAISLSPSQDANAKRRPPSV